MVELVWLIPALPLAGFLILMVLGRRLGEPIAGWLATIMCGGSFVASVIVFAGLLGKHEEERQFQQILFDWIPAGNLKVQLGFLVDPLSVSMVLFVTGVGTLIHLYSIGYMHGDKNFSKFFVYMNLFTFSMLMLVLGNNLVVTFLGWEGVGACSYFLIAFWFSDTANASAGKKAFVTNRVGDWGFMVATFLAFSAAGTVTYFANGANPGLLDEHTLAGLAAVSATGIAALLFVGAVGKSAQLPLYLWLPDAMAGPTPVSALIHAATMVTAGVYLMIRVSPLLAHGYTWLPTTIAVIGAVTALFAATIAVAQNDIKKVLAYSTVSQLGYMFLAVGSGAYVAALFHMITHAMFKALLFLGAGSVIHGMHDEQDMRKMGGLRKLMPLTAGTFIVGWLAIAGIPPFAGFWSKDEILLAAWDKSVVLWFLGFVTALLTAYYMSRQVFMVFFGEKRFDEEHVHPHDPTWTMGAPLVVLSLGALVAGFINLPFTDDTKFLESWLAPVLEGVEHHVDVSGATQAGLIVLTVAVCLVGIVFARRVYLQHKVPVERVEPKVLAHAWYYDETVSAFVGGPGEKAFEETARFDSGIIDGAVNGVAAIVRWVASKLRLTQTGYVRNYALGIAVGAFILVGLFLTKAGG